VAAPMPREHGAWSMLAQPFVCALILAGRLSWAVIPAAAAMAAVFLLRTPLVTLARQRWIWREERPETAGARRWIGGLGVVLAGSAAVLGAVGPWREWAWMGAGATALTGLSVWVNVRNRQRSIPFQVASAAALSGSALAGSVAATGRIEGWAWWLWGLCWAHAAAAILVVHARLEARIGKPRQQTARWAQIALLVAGAAFAGTFKWWIAAALIGVAAAHLWSLWRLSDPEELKRPLKSVGWRAVAVSVGFSAMVVAGLWTRGAAFEHSAWDRVLKAAVNEIGEVDYAALKGSGDLRDYVHQIEQASPASRPELFPTRADELAYYINAYNALTTWGVVQVYPVKSIGSTEEARGRFFRSTVYTVGGERISLEDLENKILQAKYHEPRIHFAIVCASLSCPNLSRTAYTAANVEAQLEGQARQYFGEARNLAVDASLNRVTLAKILDWYKADFEAVQGRSGPEALLAYALRYAPAEQRKAVESMRQPRVVFREYDWSINDPGSRSRSRAIGAVQGDRPTIGVPFPPIVPHNEYHILTIKMKRGYFGQSTSASLLMMESNTDLIQGTLDMLVLKTLSLGPMHGFGISRRIEQVSHGVFKVNPGSLLTAFQRLERKGWLDSEWRATDNSRRAKFYSLTRSGKKQLEVETVDWNRRVSAIARLLKAEA
jgi:PadR family transcriptional regulator, regulatory protein PadR